MSSESDVPSSAGAPRSRRRFTALALLGPADFDAARREIADFENWATYQDYVCGREGLAMGLSVAGEDTRLVAVSLRAFKSWRRRARSAPSVANLDAFAAWLQDKRAAASGVPEPAAGAAFALDAYLAWILCLRTLPFHVPPPSLEDYARLLRESD